MSKDLIKPSSSDIIKNNSDLVKSDTDTTLSSILDGEGFRLEDTVAEMGELMKTAKESKSPEAMKVRMELIKHAQALHGSKASKKQMNFAVFVHPGAGERLDY